MQLVRILITIAIALAWIVGMGVARARLDDHRLPEYPRPDADQSIFWYEHIGDPSRYRPSGQRWVRLYWFAQLGPIVLLILFAKWWG